MSVGLFGTSQLLGWARSTLSYPGLRGAAIVVTSWPGSTSQKSREMFTEYVLAPKAGWGVGEVILNVTIWQGLGTHVGSAVKFAASPTGRGTHHYIKTDVATTTAPNSA